MVTFVIVPPVMLAAVRAFDPLPMPLIALTTVEKSLSSCDRGIEVVAVAKVYGIVIGRGIRTSL